jgi:FkbM family methyltransferase
MPRNLRAFGRQLLGPTRYQRLSQLKAAAQYGLFAVPFVRLVSLLPKRQFVQVRENLKRIERLDYRSGDLKLKVETLEHVGRLRSCAKEPGTVRWIESHVKPGDVFYDIGANVGAYTLVAFRHTHGRRSIVAFEPAFATFATLCENLAINQCGETVIPLNVALTERTGVLTFNFSDTTSGAALHAVGDPISQDGESFRPVYVQPVLAYRLDDLIEQMDLPAPNHIKIDVDGAEPSILRGAEKTLRTGSVRSLLIEANDTLPSRDEIVRIMGDYGYSVRERINALTMTEFSYYLFEPSHRES